MTRLKRILLALFLTLSMLLCACSAHEPTPKLSVTVIDVKHGDCILLQSPDGQTMMIDTGNGSYNAQTAIRETLKNAGVQKLDILVLTHPHKDHIGGAAWVLETYEVGAVYTTARANDTDLYRSTQEALAQKGLTPQTVAQGDSFSFGPVQADVLSPYDLEDKEINNTSLVLRLTYGQNRLLFMGDAEDKVEKALVKQYGDALRATFLKVGHHGIDTATNKFLDAVQPKLAVISKDGDEGYEDKKLEKQQKAYENLAMHDVTLYRTDRAGTLTFAFAQDGSYDAP